MNTLNIISEATLTEDLEQNSDGIEHQGLREVLNIQESEFTASSDMQSFILELQQEGLM